MNMKELEDQIIRHEGMVKSIYYDHLKKPTIGVGHLITPEDNFKPGEVYEEDELRAVFRKDLKRSIAGAEDLINNCKANISDDAKCILIEMVFQLGKNGVSKFRNMWKSLQEDPPNYFEAHVQMLDSKWAKQTPNRAHEMAQQMQDCK